ncbi:MAG: DUF5455 family protein [Methylococcales bacterium]
MLAAFVATVNALVSNISVIIPSEFETAWGWLMPSNAQFCFEALISGRAAHWLYLVNKELVTQRYINAKIL